MAQEGEKMSVEQAEKTIKLMEHLTKRLAGSYDKNFKEIGKHLNEVAEYAADLTVPKAADAIKDLSTAYTTLGKKMQDDSDPAVLETVEPQYQKLGELITAIYDSLSNQIKMRQGVKNLKGAAKQTASQIEKFRDSIMISKESLENQMEQAKAAYKAQGSQEGPESGAYAKQKKK